jgi:HEAT repeat protein
MRRKGRTTAFVAAGLLAAAAGIAAASAWDLIREEWRIHRLVRASAGERSECLKMLLDVASARSIRPLLDLLEDCGGSIHPAPSFGVSADGIIEALLIILGRDCGAAANRLAREIDRADPVLRVLVAACLGEVGFDNRPGVAALGRMLSDEAPLVVESALWALGSSGECAYPILLEALASGDPRVRQTAVLALGRRSRHAEEVRTALLALANDPDERVQNAVRYVLQGVPETPATAAPGGARELAESLLGELAASRNWSERVELRWKLVACGPGAVPSLLEGLSTGDPLVRREVVEALAAIGHPSAIPAIERALGDADGVVRNRAARALLGLQDADG